MGEVSTNIGSKEANQNSEEGVTNEDTEVEEVADTKVGEGKTSSWKIVWLEI